MNLTFEFWKFQLFNKTRLQFTHDEVKINHATISKRFPSVLWTSVMDKSALSTLRQLRCVIFRNFMPHRRAMKKKSHQHSLTQKKSQNSPPQLFSTAFFWTFFLLVLPTINYQNHRQNNTIVDSETAGAVVEKKSHLKWNRSADNNFWSVLLKDSIESDVLLNQPRQ